MSVADCNVHAQEVEKKAPVAQKVPEARKPDHRQDAQHKAVVCPYYVEYSYLLNGRNNGCEYKNKHKNA